MRLARGKFLILGELALTPRRRLRSVLRGCDATIYRSARKSGRLTGVILGDHVQTSDFPTRPGGAAWISEVELEERWGFLDDTNDRLTRLRGLVQEGAPTRECWLEIITLLTVWPTGEGVEIGLRYVTERTASWPDAVKVGFVRWSERALAGTREPRLALVRALDLAAIEHHGHHTSRELIEALIATYPEELAHLRVTIRQLRALARLDLLGAVPWKSLDVCASRRQREDQHEPWFNSRWNSTQAWRALAESPRFEHLERITHDPGVMNDSGARALRDSKQLRRLASIEERAP